ncbi:MAG: hypothetical protein ACOYEG_06410 [Petrimonas sp.]|jgi:macrodomain Ter protein organizer (MatP/YcbG family)
MSTNSLSVEKKKVKRKNIDIPEDTFRYLSIKAAAQGTNLKKYIENLLAKDVGDMENIEDSELYRYLVQTKPEGKLTISDKEAEEFENWLGV